MEWAEIRWYRFKAPDKERPVLILTRDTLIPHLGEIVVAPISTTLRKTASHVHIDERDGVPRPSAILLDHLQSVPRGRIGARVCTLSSQRMNDVREALLFALGYDA